MTCPGTYQKTGKMTTKKRITKKHFLFKLF
jgi:hypothetical protein